MSTPFNTTISVIIDIDTPPLLGLEENRPTYRIVIEIVTILIIWISSIPLNILVCLVIYRSRRVQSTTNYFVISLAMSDLMISVLCVPFVMSRVIANQWVLGGIMCRCTRLVQTLAPTTSIFVLVLISIDRFYTIIYPLSFKITRGTAKQLIICCWVLSFIVCIFPIYFFETIDVNDGSGKSVCPTYVPNQNYAGISYGSALVLVTLLIPAIFILVVYTRIFRYVWTAGVGKRRIRRTMNPVPRTKVKMLKMLIFASALTLVCVFPLYMVQLWFTFSKTVYVNPSIFIGLFWLLYLPTSLKPVIYMMYNTNFRRGCREVFCMTKLKCYRSNTYAITTASNLGKKNHIGIMPPENMQRGFISPSMAFNRNTETEKMAWPVHDGISTTYI